MTIQTKRFSKLAVGIRHHDKKGFVQPDEPAPGSKQRIESITNWMTGYGRPEKNNKLLRGVDNEPLAGFKISGSAKRYSTSNKFVELLDPRGWEIEVSI